MSPSKLLGEAVEGGIYTLICKKVGEIVILSVCESFLRMTGCYFFPAEFYSFKENKEGQRKHLSLSWSPFSTGEEQIVKREMSVIRRVWSEH